MKKYIGTKIIEAESMKRGDYNTYRGWTIPADENPADEGYLVKYPDGYESWSPKKQFKEAYRAFDGGMPIGSAIELLKQGFKVARKGWNGKGMFIYLSKGYSIPVEDVCNNSLREYFYKTTEDGIVHINSHIDMKAADGTIVIGWLASQTDMLAEDWVVVE